MALSKEQWDAINAATLTLRSMGCAVCVFTTDDVEGAGEGEDGVAEITPAAAAGWMDRNRRHLESAMSSIGNTLISSNAHEIAAAA